MYFLHCSLGKLEYKHAVSTPQNRTCNLGDNETKQVNRLKKRERKIL